MEPTITVKVFTFVWTDDKQFKGSHGQQAEVKQSEIAISLDNMYSELQAQVDDVGGYVVVVPKFVDNDHLEATFPPKILTPIRKIQVPIVRPMGGLN